jgi:hypothetical protein
VISLKTFDCRFVLKTLELTLLDVVVEVELVASGEAVNYKM